jgi:hypothetical protein
MPGEHYAAAGGAVAPGVRKLSTQAAFATGCGLSM